MLKLGAKHAVLTAKHDSGFLLWPTNTTLPDGSPYEYCVGHKRSAIDYDILGRFTASMEKAGLGAQKARAVAPLRACTTEEYTT